MRWWIFIFLLLVPCVLAHEVKLGLNQSDYYFQIKESAKLPLEIENTYGRVIVGNLTLAIAQRMDNEGTRWSSPISHSREFSINKGKNVIDLGFGRADTPILLKVDLDFRFGENRSVALPGVVIHYVPLRDNGEEVGVEMLKSSGLDEEEMMVTLEMFPGFLEIENELKGDGFLRSNVEFEQFDNATLVLMFYGKEDVYDKLEVWFAGGDIVAINHFPAEKVYWWKLLLCVVVVLFIWYMYERQHCKKEISILK